MSEERTNLEIIAPTVEEAVSKGLRELGLPEEAVEVEVLDAGSRGLFGIGSRHARIRLTIKRVSASAPAAAAKPQAAPRPAAQPAAQPATASQPAPAAAPAVLAPRDVNAAPVETVAPARKPAPTPAPIESEEPSSPAEPEGDEDHDLRVARETVTELLEKMGVKGRVTAKFIEGDSSKDEPQILVEIHGNDLSILIGRKSETLNAIQYISSLIVGKELGKWISVQLDVEGYRQRRERALRQLARRMADQAISTGHRQVLEPMPANERRVIHMELRDHAEVITESIGEEPNRKVTISLKK